MGQSDVREQQHLDNQESSTSSLLILSTNLLLLRDFKLLQELLHYSGGSLVHLVQTLHVDHSHVGGQHGLPFLVLTLLHLGVELEVKGGGAVRELRDGFVLAAVGEAEPIVLSSPAGGQVGEPGEEERPLVRRQPGDEVGSGDITLVS